MAEKKEKKKSTSLEPTKKVKKMPVPHIDVEVVLGKAAVATKVVGEKATEIKDTAIAIKDDIRKLY